ncbi:hypothetical protein [Actinomadura rupiterrae]|uniref:hypothetical protein n=1 Tax=Actinomadura rupiterrae TaxID=559627 RepID=UPI0020A27392|nr:hypothetical protein [Actinomadura rupiterrae]MCP2340192.1 hypothetical protein [Actinomadura rupiterrae]
MPSALPTTIQPTSPPTTPTPGGPTPHHPSTASAIAFAALLLIALFIAWRISLRTHPWTRCPKCKGDPRSYHPIFSRHFALCPRCNGTGRVLRKGAPPQ